MTDSCWSAGAAQARPSWMGEDLRAVWSLRGRLMARLRVSTDLALAAQLGDIASWPNKLGI